MPWSRTWKASVARVPSSPGRSAFGGSLDQAGYDTLRTAYQKQLTCEFETAWRKVVHDGLIPNTALPAKTLAAKTGGWPAGPQAAQGMEVVIRPDPTIWYSRF